MFTRKKKKCLKRGTSSPEIERNKEDKVEQIRSINIPKNMSLCNELNLEIEKLNLIENKQNTPMETISSN
jgi:hypothetical protein